MEEFFAGGVRIRGGSFFGQLTDQSMVSDKQRDVPDCSPSD